MRFQLTSLSSVKEYMADLWKDLPTSSGCCGFRADVIEKADAEADRPADKAAPSGSAG